MTKRTSIQTIAQLRSDLLDRSHAIDLSKRTLPADGVERLTADYSDRQQSEDTFQLLNVMLTQPATSLGDVLALAIGIAELAAQAFNVDDKNANDAGSRVQLAAESMVAFLGGKVRPLNATDRSEVDRCRWLCGARFPQPGEA